MKQDSIIPADAYERWRTLPTDYEFQIEEAYPLMDQVATNEGWNDPALDVYDQRDA
jgi:hypothetical protein